MRKIGLLIILGMVALFLSACGDSEKDEIISLHDDLYDLTEDIEDKMAETEEVFMQYLSGAMDESEYDEEKSELNDYVSDKKDELDKINEPKKDKAVEYYDLSKTALTGAFDMIDFMLDIPELTDEDALIQYSEDLDEKVETVDDDMQAVEDFQEDLKDEDDDYKEAFDKKD